MLLIFLTMVVGGCSNPRADYLSTSFNTRYNEEKPAISGDGRWLAFVSNRHGRQEILLYDLEQKTFVPLPYMPNAVYDSPSLSRTGRYLAYIASVQGRPDIFIYDRITKENRMITQGYHSWLRNPRISPDGRYLVFETARRGQWDIEVVDLGPFMEPDLPDGMPVDQTPPPG